MTPGATTEEYTSAHAYGSKSAQKSYKRTGFSDGRQSRCWRRPQRSRATTTATASGAISTTARRRRVIIGIGGRGDDENKELGGGERTSVPSTTGSSTEAEKKEDGDDSIGDGDDIDDTGRHRGTTTQPIEDTDESTEGAGAGRKHDAVRHGRITGRPSETLPTKLSKLYLS